MRSPRRPAHLELLPTEILFELIHLISGGDLKNLSCVSERFRKICLPYLFREVRFEFSDSGIKGLQRFLLSEVHQYVVSVSYIIPEMLQPQVKDFEYFKTHIPSIEAFLSKSNDKLDQGYPTEMYVPYPQVYNHFKDICTEQHGILERFEDSTALSAALKQLTNMSELCLCFRQTLVKDDWMGFYMDHTVGERTLKHHFHVISNAAMVGREVGTFIRTLCLQGLELPYQFSRQASEGRSLGTHLCNLLEYAHTLRLSGSGSPLKLLSCRTLPLRQLDLCRLTVHQSFLDEFLRNNASSIGLIGLHDVTLIISNPMEHCLVELSPAVAQKIIGAKWSVIKNSSCLLCQQRGWRLLNTSLFALPID